MITFGSLFSGIGGIDLGLERAGMVCKWQVEIDDFCQKVLQKHWPEVRKYRDVREVGKHNLEPVDLIAGGFPCQDVSLAGKRAGLEGKRSTLWSEFYRIICEIQPRWVFIENVRGLLSSDNGRFMQKILWNLSQSGYDAEWDTLPAALFGAPQLRHRVYIVANAKNNNGGCSGFPYIFSEKESGLGKYRRLASKVVWNGIQVDRKNETSYTRSFPEPIFLRMVNGLSAKVGRGRYRSTGNAVVPQVAEYIGRCIVEADKSLTQTNK